MVPFVSSVAEVFSDKEVFFCVFEEREVVAFILFVGPGMLLKLAKDGET